MLEKGVVRVITFMLRCPASLRRLAVGIPDAGSYIRGQVKEQILRRGGQFWSGCVRCIGVAGKKTTGEQ